MVVLDPLFVPADAVDEAKAYMRIDHDDEDAVIGGLITTGIVQCEAFCALVLVARQASQRLNLVGGWQRLGATPVRAISQVTGFADTGPGFVLAVEHYALDIDQNGCGWFRLLAAAPVKRVEVSYQVGLADHWGASPAPIRQGIIRLVAHLHAHRDGADDIGPPAAVAALWRPWRRARLI